MVSIGLTHLGPANANQIQRTRSRLSPARPMPYQKGQILLAGWTIIGIASAALSGPPLNATAMHGVIAFHKGGNLDTAVTIGHVLIRLSTAQLRNLTKAAREELTSSDLRGLARNADTALARFNTDLQSLHDTPDRQPRGLFSILGGALGLFNIWQIHDLKTQLSRSNTRLRGALHQVQALTEFTKKNQEAMMNATRRLWEEDHHLRLIMRWERIQTVLGAFSDVVNSLRTHHLSPAILELVDLPSAWRDFNSKLEQGFESGPVSYFQLTRCPLSFGLNGDELWIAVHVPVRQEHTKPFVIHHPRWLPLIRNQTAYEFHMPGNDLLAISSDGSEYQLMDKEQQSRCIALGPDMYCVGTAAILQKGHHACLVALWEKNWRVAKETCHMSARPARFGAWTVDNKHVAVYAPEPLLFLTKCAGYPVSRQRLVGYVLVWLREGCDAVSETLFLRAGLAGLPHEKTVLVTMDAVDLTDVVDDGNENGTFPVRWPAPVASIRHLVEEAEADAEDSENGPSFWIILALALGGGAAVLAVAFLAYFYYRFRRAARMVSREPVV